MKRAAMEKLLDIRDAVSVARNLISGVYMAAQAPTVPDNERAAICVISNIAREQLEVAEAALDALIAQGRPGDPA